MPKLAIEVEVEEISCCVCGRKEQLQPTVVELLPPFQGERSSHLWRATSRSHPPGWKTVGGEQVCSGCWAEFLDFAAAKKPKPPNL